MEIPYIFEGGNPRRARFSSDTNRVNLSDYNILIACEFSGIVREAFRRKGFRAVSADLLPTEQPGPHIEGDCLELLTHPWNLIIAFPPCTYLANSGVRWLGEDKERWVKMKQAVKFFSRFLKASAFRIAVENPTMHRHTEIRKPDFVIQPWQFGHGETKRTCFWTKHLPSLRSTKIVSGRKPRVAHESPGPDRWKRRSRTLEGIAEAMADQWGVFVDA